MVRVPLYTGDPAVPDMDLQAAISMTKTAYRSKYPVLHLAPLLHSISAGSQKIPGLLG